MSLYMCFRLDLLQLFILLVNGVGCGRSLAAYTGDGDSSNEAWYRNP